MTGSRWRRALVPGCPERCLSNHKLKSALKCIVWSQCTPVLDRQTDRRTDEHHGNSATIRSTDASRAKDPSSWKNKTMQWDRCCWGNRSALPVPPPDPSLYCVAQDAGCFRPSSVLITWCCCVVCLGARVMRPLTTS